MLIYSYIQCHDPNYVSSPAGSDTLKAGADELHLLLVEAETVGQPALCRHRFVNSDSIAVL